MFWRYLATKPASVEWNVLWLTMLKMPPVQHGYRDRIGEFCSAATLREACRVGNPRAAVHGTGRPGRPLGAAKDRPAVMVQPTSPDPPLSPFCRGTSRSHQIRQQRHTCLLSSTIRSLALADHGTTPTPLSTRSDGTGQDRTGQDSTAQHSTAQDETRRNQTKPNQTERHGRNVGGATTDGMGREVTADCLSRMWAVGAEKPLMTPI